MIDGHEGRTLDIGCGPGIMLNDLYRRGFEPFGFDISKAMVKTAREHFLKLEDSTPFLCVADVENLPFIDGSFELVVCAGVIEYLGQDYRALQEISRVLKPRGIAFITVTNALAPFWFIETIAKIVGVWSKLVSYVKGDSPFPIARVHIPSSLVNMASRVGLVEIDRAYFDFSAFPFPINVIFPNLCKRIGMSMEQLSRTKLGFIGRGCILKFVKNR